ncbi:MAG: L-glyceraldehyde 3-phosphate reductase [Anaerolineales bacterium]|nr:L-glyceraldehyde 3-phosphate reductase [Anaerolineales bacterium]
MDMIYRRLGRAGIQVSLLSFGSWVTFHNQAGVNTAAEMMRAAYEAGVNFFDNAEVYAGGKSEEVMGAALKGLGWRRSSYIISTKFFWGLERGVNERNTLNRKRLLEGMDGSLQRLGLDYVDLVFCHRPDRNTPIEETAHTMHDIIQSGRAIYWGVSMWSADEIRAAWLVCDKYGWHKPQMEQPEYNLFSRQRVELEYARLYEDIGLGTTIWSPLASGLLTGKYQRGIPKNSRGGLKGYGWLKDKLSDKESLAKVAKLGRVAKDLDCTLAQLALAWCAKNEHVSTVITGASRVEQVKENMQALKVLPKLKEDVMKRIDGIVGKPEEEE